MPPIKRKLAILLTFTLLSSITAISLHSIPAATAQAASPGTAATPPAQDKVLPLKWKVATDGSGVYDNNQPVLNGILYYSVSNTLYAKNIASGQVLWSYKQGEHPQIITNNSVFFIDNNEQLVKISASSGKLLWKVKVSVSPIEIGAQARLMNGKVYFFNERGVVAAYHPVTGKKLWENKNIPMYVGTLYGEYNGVLVVSSTVDNIRTQFYGLDPSTGKKLWRIEGLYSYVAYQNGQFILREQAKPAAGTAATAVPGYQLTMVHLNPATGKISGQENYNPLADISRLGNYSTAIQNPYVYSVDSNPDTDEYILTRFSLGANIKPGTGFKSYESFGNWLSGPAGGRAFFQQGAQITEVNLADDSVIPLDTPAGKAEKLQRVGKAVFVIYNNGYMSINDSDTGALLGMIKTGAAYFGNITIDKGTALIPTEQHTIAVDLPKEYQ